MPNQLAQTKRRQSLSEQAAVLDALAEIARRENSTLMDEMRQAIRAHIKAKVEANPELRDVLKAIADEHRPRLPENITRPSQVARYKGESRQHDWLLLDLGLETPREVQMRNGLGFGRESIRAINFEQAHAAAV